MSPTIPRLLAFRLSCLTLLALGFHALTAAETPAVDPFTTTTIKDRVTGRTYRAAGRATEPTTHMYYTGNSWTSDSRSIVVTTGGNPGGAPLQNYLYDTTTGKGRYLIEATRHSAGDVSRDDVFYAPTKTQVLGVNLKSGETKIVFTGAPDITIPSMPTVSNDGKTLGLVWQVKDQWVVGILDIPSGKLREVARPHFAAPYQMPSHPLINPGHPTQLLFMHEGTTDDIPDRIWSTDVTTGKSAVLYQQKLSPEGKLGEFVGHECWTRDGETLYFVKYKRSPLKPTGIAFVSRDGTKSGMINSDHLYWHESPSPDGKWIVADTTVADKKNQIYLINIADRTSTQMCEVSASGENPGHQHPSFSPDSRKISFTFTAENGQYAVGFMDVSDLTMRSAR